MSDLSASSRGGVVDFVFEIPEYGKSSIVFFSSSEQKAHFMSHSGIISPTPPPAYDVAKLLCCDISV